MKIRGDHLAGVPVVFKGALLDRGASRAGSGGRGGRAGGPA